MVIFGEFVKHFFVMIVYVTCNTNSGRYAKTASQPSAVPGDLSVERLTSLWFNFDLLYLP